MFKFLKKRSVESTKAHSQTNGSKLGSFTGDHYRNTLYSLGTVINVMPSERFDLSSRQDGYYIIARGTASMLLNDQIEIQSMGEGQGVSTLMLPDSGLYSLSLRGREGFKLVHVSGAAIKTIDTPLKSEIDRSTLHAVKKIKKSTPAMESSRELPGEYVRSCLKNERHALLGRYDSSSFIKEAMDEVRSLPTVTQRFIGLSLSDSVSNAEITAFVKNNPSLATEVLRVVNSSFHGLRNKVTDINYALLYLGLSQIFQIVAAAGLQSMAGKSTQLSGITNHSIILSNVASLLSAAGGRKPSPIVATIGILHDVGEIFKTLIKEKHKGMELLIDHLSGPKLGSMLLAQWGIPEPICKAIELQEQSPYSLPDELDEDCRKHLACLHLGHRVCEFVNEEGGLPTDPLTQAYLSFVGFGNMSLEQLVRLYIIPELRANTNKLPIEVQVFFSI
jgi:HD-like signal output (HDOD) protein